MMQIYHVYENLGADLVSVPEQCRAECGNNNLSQDHFAPYRVDYGFFQQSFFFIGSSQFSELFSYTTYVFNQPPPTIDNIE